MPRNDVHPVAGTRRLETAFEPNAVHRAMLAVVPKRGALKNPVATPSDLRGP